MSKAPFYANYDELIEHNFTQNIKNNIQGSLTQNVESSMSTNITQNYTLISNESATMHSYKAMSFIAVEVIIDSNGLVVKGGEIKSE